MMPRFTLTCATLALSCVLCAADLRSGFANPPDDARIMMRWWWFGPSVTREQLGREMLTMKQGGIGGFEVQPVYPLRLEGNTRFLSPEFLDALSFTASRSKELGLRFDLTLGSGWPFGGPKVPLAEAAGRLRVEKLRASGETALPALREGETVVAVFGPDGKEITPSRNRTVGATGEVLVFIASHTRQAVKRASVGAEGYVLDHYSRTALDHYLSSVGKPLVDAVRANPPRAIFCDSLEVFGSDWTPDLLAEFQTRRGYDLRPHLPALVRDAGPATAAIRHDWGLTLTELLEDRFLKPLHAFAQANHTLLRMQDYGIPPALMSSNALIDLPEGEGSQWKVVRASRWASSASHIYGKAATSSETWTWLHSPVFRATPLDMKAEADIHFLQGITQLIGHGWPYTAEGVEYPGTRFYAAAVFNDKNPWWIVMPDVAKYLQRVSWLMRQGRPAADVALYLPNADVWSGFTTGGHVHMIEQLREYVGPEVMPQILESGYGLDFFDDAALRDRGEVKAGELRLGGNPYRIVVLPGVEYIPLRTFRTLDEFAKAGGRIIATRRVPALAPGLKATAAETAEIRAISARLFPNGAVPDAELGKALRGVLPPDLLLSRPAPDVGFIHRTTGDAEIYFVANTTNTPQKLDATFRVAGGMTAELWDPFTGRVSPAPNAGPKLPLHIEPYGSRVVVFSRAAAKPGPASSPASVQFDLSRDWTVTFGDKGPPVRMATLRSWTDDERTKFFSGVATYEKTFELASVPSTPVVLSFGEGTALPIPPDGGRRAGPGMQTFYDAPVREAAVVYVNGRRAGSVWAPPYQVDISGLLKQGSNQLRIDVANLAVNYMAGHSLPDYKALNAKYGVRFEPQDMDKLRAEPSGLLGVVKLLGAGPRPTGRN
jgi:hypothetical protein